MVGQSGWGGDVVSGVGPVVEGDLIGDSVGPSGHTDRDGLNVTGVLVGGEGHCLEVGSLVGTNCGQWGQEFGLFVQVSPPGILGALC